MRRTRYPVRVAPEQLERLRALARARDSTISDLVVEHLDAVVGEAERGRLPSVALDPRRGARAVMSLGASARPVVEHAREVAFRNGLGWTRFVDAAVARALATSEPRVR